MRDKKLFRYLLLTFAITYVFWGFDILLSRLGYYEHPGYNIGILFYILAASSPGITMFILLQKEPDKKGIRYFLKTFFRFHHPLAELSLMLAFLTIRFAVPFLFGDGKVIGNWWQVALFVPIMLFFGGFEEIGWRGYLQDELESRFGSIVATLINCGIWAVWHLPLCLIKGTYQYSESYLWFIVSLTASAFALAAIHKVGGSVLPCILFHAVGNAIVSYGISGNEGTGMIVSSAVQIICAIGVFVFCDRTKKKVNK